MILEKIAESTRKRVEKLKALNGDSVKLEALSMPTQPPFRFENALKTTDMAFICEVKKASPSKGVIDEEFDYVKIALEYEEAGAAALSVLTEPEFFMGSNIYLAEIAKRVKIPILRKDFTIDEYQIYESKVLGASAVLLICALLDTDTLKRFISIADSLGLSCVVEAHDEHEIDSAIKAGARVVGVNNRNLNDFSVDISNSFRLGRIIPEDVIFISESGIKTPEDIRELKKYKTNAVLIGETLMRSDDKKKKITELKGGVYGV